MKRAEPVDPEVLVNTLQRRGTGGRPTDDSLAPDERDGLRASIAELPPEQRRALFIAAYLGRTAKEPAELEGIPVGTAKSRIRAAMLRLRDSLEAKNAV